MVDGVNQLDRQDAMLPCFHFYSAPFLALRLFLMLMGLLRTLFPTANDSKLLHTPVTKSLDF